MILNNEETLDTIHRLLLLYVPNCFDRQNVFDKLAEVGKALLAPTPTKRECPTCGNEMVCLDCANITIHSDVETTVQVNGREIYA